MNNLKKIYFLSFLFFCQITFGNECSSDFKESKNGTKLYKECYCSLQKWEDISEMAKSLGYKVIGGTVANTVINGEHWYLCTPDFEFIDKKMAQADDCQDKLKKLQEFIRKKDYGAQFVHVLCRDKNGKVKHF